MILASTVMAMSVNAQVYVGGGIGVSTTGGDNTDDVTSYKFVPEIGYTINSEWAAGMAFGWEGSNKGGAKTFSINPYVRYNVINGKVVNVFLDGSVEFGHKYNAGFDDDFFGVGLKPGVAFKVNEKISVVTHIGFIGYERQNHLHKLHSYIERLAVQELKYGLYILACDREFSGRDKPRRASDYADHESLAAVSYKLVVDEPKPVVVFLGQNDLGNKALGVSEIRIREFL